jgi:hypothetical protein
MTFTLSSHNVIQYLRKLGVCSLEDNVAVEELPVTSGKNVNLLVTTFQEYRPGENTAKHVLLVKQEKNISARGIPQEFFQEWLFSQMLQKFPVLGNIAEIASLVVHFDEENSILVRNYLGEYLELGKFYQTYNIYPCEIAAAIGTSLGVLHRATFNRREYRDFIAAAPQGQFRYQFYNPAQGIESISPDTFGEIASEALQFYILYQRYESVEAAIAKLATLWEPCCLTHNDLKLENILVHSRWNQLDNCLVRLIDWEACAWGEPAFDLGTVVASYLRMWLESLVRDPAMELEESLQLAAVPLETLQPSILALVQAYLVAFPMILEYRRDLIEQVVQFAGLVLLHQMQQSIQYRKHFDNSSICIFQVAKALLTNSQESISTVLGISKSQLLGETFTNFANKQNLVRLYQSKTYLRGC